MRVPNFFILCSAGFLIFGLIKDLTNDLTDARLAKIPVVKYMPAVKLQADQSAGNQLYKKYCLTCHQADGTGVHGMFPPLAGNAKITGSSTDLIRIVLFGLEGPVTVNGREYNQPMPAQGYLSDKQIADILSYIRNDWGNKARIIKPDEVGKVRKLGKVKQTI